MSGRSEVWSSSHYMSRKQFVRSTSSGVGGKVLVTGQVRLFSLNDRQATPWFSSPLPDLILWVTVTVMTVTLSEWERHSERYPFWLTALRHCRCRFITRSKRPVQCLGQNDKHVTSKHGVGFDTIQKVKKSINLTSFSRFFSPWFLPSRCCRRCLGPEKPKFESRPSRPRNAKEGNASVRVPKRQKNV